MAPTEPRPATAPLASAASPTPAERAGAESAAAVDEAAAGPLARADAGTPDAPRPPNEVAAPAAAVGIAGVGSPSAARGEAATAPGMVDEVAPPADAAAAGEAGDGALEAALEAILFVAERPVEPAELARATGADEAVVRAALARLAAALAAGRGLRLQTTRDGVQLVTAPQFAPSVERFLGSAEPARLSPAALETLAIVAYRQPVTRGAIEAIRGVSADRALATLLGRGLVVEVGRLESAGRPALFGTTAEFLHLFGLTSLDELPPFERFAELAGREADAQPAPPGPG